MAALSNKLRREKEASQQNLRLLTEMGSGVVASAQNSTKVEVGLLR